MKKLLEDIVRTTLPFCGIIVVAACTLGACIGFYYNIKSIITYMHTKRTGDRCIVLALFLFAVLAFVAAITILIATLFLMCMNVFASM